MSEEKIADFAKFDLNLLDRFEQLYLSQNDPHNLGIIREAIKRRGAVQTTELENSGQLFKHTETCPDSGRVTHRFTGDPSAWMREFSMDPIQGRFNGDINRGANSLRARTLAASTRTVTVGPGERVVVVKD